MNNKKDNGLSELLPFITEGVVAPFGDNFDGEIANDTNEVCRCEKGYENLCKNCKGKIPESMKKFISSDFGDLDEVYYCNWCDFIRATEIDELVMENIRKKSVAQRKDYDDYEDDGADAMWELEYAGAFSDEGIMPGCHSGNWDYEYETESIAKEFEDMEFVGNLLRIAREKIGMTKEEVANKLDIPESFVTDLEEGQYISRYGKSDNKAVMPVANPIVVPITVDVSTVECKEKEWWHNLSDDQIAYKLADFLVDPNQENSKTSENQENTGMTDFNVLSF